MRQIKPKAPCTQNCPNRNGSCHSTCEAFREYDRLRIEFAKRREEEINRQANLERKLK